MTKALINNKIRQKKFSLIKKVHSQRGVDVFVAPILHARVPIIKMRFQGIDCDLSAWSSINSKKAELMAEYRRIDPRVTPFLTLLKQWTKIRQIGDASQNTINSFACIMLGIQFLQQLNPPIVPCLQQDRNLYNFDYASAVKKNINQNLPVVCSLFFGGRGGGRTRGCKTGGKNWRRERSFFSLSRFVSI